MHAQDTAAGWVHRNTSLPLRDQTGRAMVRRTWTAEVRRVAAPWPWPWLSHVAAPSHARRPFAPDVVPPSSSPSACTSLSAPCVLSPRSHTTPLTSRFKVCARKPSGLEVRLGEGLPGSHGCQATSTLHRPPLLRRATRKRSMKGQANHHRPLPSCLAPHAPLDD